jgi:hypothetical protein
MSGLIVLVLVCLLFGIVEPGVGEPIRQMAFSLFGVVDEGGAEVGAALRTGGYGAGSTKGRLLATLALQGDVGWMPLVGYAERDYANLVVCLHALDDLHHRRLPLSPPFQVAVPHSHAAFTCHVTLAGYSCPIGMYVPQSTKCCGVQRWPFGERMVATSPGCDDLLFIPLPEIGWSGTPHLGAAFPLMTRPYFVLCPSPNGPGPPRG